MRLDFQALQCLVAVAEQQHMTLAAKQLNRTQSAVTQQIQKLERRLNQRLLTWVPGQGWQPTFAGEQLLGYARSLLALHDQAITALSAPPLADEVRFGIPEDFASIYLEQILGRFRKRYPNVAVHVTCDLTVNLYERFQNGDFDLVLVKMSDPSDLPDGNRIWAEPLCWVSDMKFPVARYAGQHAKLPLPLILSPAPCVFRRKALQALQQVNRPVETALVSHSLGVMLAGIRAGIGIGVMPKPLVPEGLVIHGESSPLMLPKLEETHVSLLKTRRDDPILESLARSVRQQLINH